MRKILLLLLPVISLTAIAQNRADQVTLEDPGSSTIILFGDPQAYMKYDINQPIFELTTAWVADNANNLNIKALLCTGDLVDRNESNYVSPKKTEPKQRSDVGSAQPGHGTDRRKGSVYCCPREP